MSVGFVVDGTLTLAEQEQRIRDKEKVLIRYRLTTVMPIEEPIDDATAVPVVNRTLFERVPKKDAPFSRLVSVAAGSATAAADPDIVAMMGADAALKIVWDGKMYVSGSLAAVALVR